MSTFKEKPQAPVLIEEEESSVSDAGEEPDHAHDKPDTEVDDSLLDEEEMEYIMRNLTPHILESTTARSVTLSSLPQQGRMRCQLEESTIAFRSERHPRKSRK